MLVQQTIKEMAIGMNLYRPARWLDRQIHAAKREAHLRLVRFYRQLIAPGSLCFDVGANIGAMSEALLEAGARVVAFEPGAAVLPELRARCAHHPDWTLVPSALGAKTEVATFYERGAHAQSGLIFAWEGQVVATRQVPVITLDDAIGQFGTPAYCKIDVEGSELQVLEGLSQPLPLLSFEFHLNKIADVDKTLACLKRLRSFGRGEVNLTQAEASAFHLSRWIALGDFADQFPRTVEKNFSVAAYGDLWVRFS
jgi:FkbM family methyltransferase